MFLDDIQEVLDADFVVDSDEEALSNLWSFSVRQTEAASLRIEEVVRFVETVLRSRSRQLNERCGSRHRMLFYCWFDDQAGQLRFSVVSDRDGRLPFRCRLNRVQDLERIVGLFLRYPYHDGIPKGTLRNVSPQASEFVDGEGDYVLDVWVRSIPTISGELSS